MARAVGSGGCQLLDLGGLELSRLGGYCGLPSFQWVALLDPVPLNLRGEWHGKARVSARVRPQGPGPGRGRLADR
jgi:hypothetical protein